MFRSPSRRIVPLLVVLGLVAPACVEPKDPGLRMMALQSDIVFGLPPETPDAVPTVAEVPTSDGSLDLTPSFAFDDDEPAPEVRVPGRPVTPRPVELCPPALANAFPKEEAGFTVDGRPAPGTYRWKRTVSTPIVGSQNPLVITSFIRHDITNVSPVTETPNPVTPDNPTKTFTYDDTTVLPNGAVTTTYQVKLNAPRQVVQGNQNFGGGVAVGTGQSVETGAPDRGVSILRTVTKDGTGKELARFEPDPPVLLLPLDVVFPSRFQSVGVDPTTGASLAVDAQITGRERIDACGEIVDGWRVVSSQTFTSASAERSILDSTYHISTQLGGLLTLSQRVAAAPARLPTDPTTTDQLGQLEPTPLP